MITINFGKNYLQSRLFQAELFQQQRVIASNKLSTIVMYYKKLLKFKPLFYKNRLILSK